jgi:hypothetical protein
MGKNTRIENKRTEQAKKHRSIPMPTLNVAHLPLAPAPRRRRALPLAREPHDAGGRVRRVVSAARRGVHDAGSARFVRFQKAHVGVGVREVGRKLAGDRDNWVAWWAEQDGR